MRQTTSEATKEAIKELSENGLGYKRIAKATGLKEPTARYWQRKLKPKTGKEKKQERLKTFETLFKRCFKVAEIAREMGLSRRTVQNWKLDLYGNQNYKRTKAQELYKKGLTVEEIAVFIKTSPTHAKRLVKEIRKN